MLKKLRNLQTKMTSYRKGSREPAVDGQGTFDDTNSSCPIEGHLNLPQPEGSRSDISTVQSTKICRERHDADKEQRVENGGSRAVPRLRCIMFLALLIAAVAVSAVVVHFTQADEQHSFEIHYTQAAEKIVNEFLHAVEGSLNALDTLGNSITSYATLMEAVNNTTFPFVTVPDFEVKGSNARISSGTHVIHWMPVVTDGDRDSWEHYAKENRHLIEEAFQEDSKLREQQDERFGREDFHCHRRYLRGWEPRRTDSEQPITLETLSDDGTGYHERIWSNGAIMPRGDEPHNIGPYLPLWQSR